MIKLDAIFVQRADLLWDARIIGIEHISVVGAEDLETAKIFLDKITAEEIAQMTRGARANWQIDNTTTIPYMIDDATRARLAKGFI